MAAYTCPTCGEKLQRDMLRFYKHTDQHIVEELKKMNPGWISNDGFCQKCLDFFKTEMSRGRIDAVSRAMNPALVNISIGGTRRRTVLGIVSGLFVVTLFI